MELDRRTGSLLTSSFLLLHLLFHLFLGLTCSPASSWPLQDVVLNPEDPWRGDLPPALEGRGNPTDEGGASLSPAGGLWTGGDRRGSDEGAQVGANSRPARERKPYVPFNSLTFMSADRNVAASGWISSNTSDIRQQIVGSKLGGIRPVSIRPPPIVVPFSPTTRRPDATVAGSVATPPDASTPASVSEEYKQTTQPYTVAPDTPESTSPGVTILSPHTSTEHDQPPTETVPISGPVTTTIANSTDPVTEAWTFASEHTSKETPLSTAVPTSVAVSTSESPVSITRFSSDERPSISLVSSTIGPSLPTKLPPTKGLQSTTKPTSVTTLSSTKRPPPTKGLSISTWFPSLSSFTSTEITPSSTGQTQTAKSTPATRPPPATETAPATNFHSVYTSQSVTMAPPFTDPTPHDTTNTSRTVTQQPSNALVNASNIPTFGLLSTWKPTYRPIVTTLQVEEVAAPTLSNPHTADDVSRRPTSSISTDAIPSKTPLHHLPPTTTTTTTASADESIIPSESATPATSTSTLTTLPAYWGPGEAPAEAASLPEVVQPGHPVSSGGPRPPENRPGGPTTFTQGHPNTDEYHNTVVYSQHENFGPSDPSGDEIPWSSPRPNSTILMTTSDHQLIREALEELTKQHQPAPQHQISSSGEPDSLLPLTKKVITNTVSTSTRETGLFSSSSLSDESEISLYKDTDETQSTVRSTSPWVTRAGAPETHGLGVPTERIPHYNTDAATPGPVWTTLSTPSRPTPPETSDDSNLTRPPTSTSQPVTSPSREDANTTKGTTQGGETAPTASTRSSQEGNDVDDFEYDFYEDDLSEYYAAYGNLWDEHEDEMDGSGPYTLGLPPPQSPNLQILTWPYTTAPTSTPTHGDLTYLWTPAPDNGHLAPQISDFNPGFHPQVPAHLHFEIQHQITPFPFLLSRPSSAGDTNLLQSPVLTAPTTLLSAGSFLDRNDHDYRSGQNDSQSLAQSSIDLYDPYDPSYSDYDDVYHYLQRQPQSPVSPTETVHPSDLAQDGDAPSPHAANETSLYLSHQSNTANTIVVNRTNFDLNSLLSATDIVPLVDLTRLLMSLRPDSDPHNLNIHNPGFLDLNYVRVEGATSSSTTRLPPVPYAPPVNEGGVLGRPGSQGQGVNLLHGQLDTFASLNPLRPHQSSYNSYAHSGRGATGEPTTQAGPPESHNLTRPHNTVFNPYLNDLNTSLASLSLRHKIPLNDTNTDESANNSSRGPSPVGVSVGENIPNSGAHPATYGRPPSAHIQSSFPTRSDVTNPSEYSLRTALLAEDDARPSDPYIEATQTFQNPNAHDKYLASNLHRPSSVTTRQEVTKTETVSQTDDLSVVLHGPAYPKGQYSSLNLEGTVLSEPGDSPAEQLPGGLLRPYVRPRPAPTLGPSITDSTPGISSLPYLPAVWGNSKLHDRPPSSLALGWAPIQHNPTSSSLTVDQDAAGLPNRPSSSLPVDVIMEPSDRPSPFVTADQYTKGSSNTSFPPITVHQDTTGPSNTPFPSVTVSAALMPLHDTMRLKPDQNHVTSTPLTRSSLPSFAVPDQISHLTPDTTRPLHQSDNTSIQFAGLRGNDHQQDRESPFGHQDLHPHQPEHSPFVLVKIWSMVGGQLVPVGEESVPTSMFRNSGLANGAVVNPQDLPPDVLTLVASSMGNDPFLDPALFRPGRARRSPPGDLDVAADLRLNSGAEQFHYDDYEDRSSSSSPTVEPKFPDNVASFHETPEAGPLQRDRTPRTNDTISIDNLINSPEVNTFQSNHSILHPNETRDVVTPSQRNSSGRYSYAFNMHDIPVSSPPQQGLPIEITSHNHSQHSRYTMRSATESFGSPELRRQSGGKTETSSELIMASKDPEVDLPVTYFIAPPAGGRVGPGLHHPASNAREAQYRDHGASYVSGYILEEDLGLYNESINRRPASTGDENPLKEVQPPLSPQVGGFADPVVGFGSAVGGVDSTVGSAVGGVGSAVGGVGSAVGGVGSAVGGVGSAVGRVGSAVEGSSSAVGGFVSPVEDVGSADGGVGSVSEGVDSAIGTADPVAARTDDDYLSATEPSLTGEVSPPHEDQPPSLLPLTRPHYGGVGNPTYSNLPLSIGTTLQENDLTYLRVLTDLANRIDSSQNLDPTLEAFISRIRSTQGQQPFSSAAGPVGYSSAFPPTGGGALASTFGNGSVQLLSQPSVPKGKLGSILELLPEDLPQVNPLLPLNEPLDRPVDLRRVLASLPSPSALHRERLQSRLAAITGTNTFSGHLGNQGFINSNGHAAQNSVSGNYGEQPAFNQLVPRTKGTDPDNHAILADHSHYPPTADSDSYLPSHQATYSSSYPFPSLHEAGQVAAGVDIPRLYATNVSNDPRRLLTVHMSYPEPPPTHHLLGHPPHPPLSDQAYYPLPSLTIQGDHPPLSSTNQENYPLPSSTNQENYPRPSSTSQDNYPRPSSTSQDNYPRPSSTNQGINRIPYSTNQENYAHSPSTTHENYAYQLSTSHETHPRPAWTNHKAYPRPPWTSQGNYPPLPWTNHGNYPYHPSPTQSFSNPFATGQTEMFPNTLLPDPSDSPSLLSTYPSSYPTQGSVGLHDAQALPHGLPPPDRPVNNYYELLGSPHVPLVEPPIVDGLAIFGPSYPYYPALNASVFWNTVDEDGPLVSPVPAISPAPAAAPAATSTTDATLQGCLSDGLCSLGVAAVLALAISNAFSLPFLAPAFLGRRRRRKLDEDLSSLVKRPDQVVPRETQIRKLLTEYRDSSDGSMTHPRDAFAVASSFILDIARISKEAHVSKATVRCAIEEKIGSLEKVLKKLSEEQLVYIIKRSLRMLSRGDPPGGLSRKGRHFITSIIQGLQASA